MCLIRLYVILCFGRQTKFSNQFAVFVALKLKLKPNQSLSCHVDSGASFFTAVKPRNKIIKLKKSVILMSLIFSEKGKNK